MNEMDGPFTMMYIRVMTSTTPNGWQLIHGREWLIHRSLPLGLSTAIEAIRSTHFERAMIRHEEDWVLDCHFARRFRFRTHGRRWRVRKPGTWHLYPRGLAWQQDTRGSALPLRAIWIRFSGAEKLGLCRLTDNPSGMAVIHDPTGYLEKEVRQLAIMGDQVGEERYSDVLKSLMDIIGHLLRSKELTVGEYVLDEDLVAFQDPLIAKINTFLEAHIHEPLTLSDIAKQLRVSISTLHRRYDNVMRESIRDALTRMRITRVKQLLSQGMTVGEAANQTGFCDLYHLSKTFRRREGLPPSEFIARIKPWRNKEE